MAENNQSVYPSALYLVKGADGKSHWYDKDPFRKTPEERDACEIEIERLLFDYFGQGTILNPLKVRVGAEMISRCEKYNALTITREYLESGNKHVEDMEGALVEILDRKNSDPAYQVNGVVMDKNGNIICFRKYNAKGECSDGSDRHSLIVMRNDKSTIVAIRQTKNSVK